MIYNELDTPSPDEQATREARWNMERAKMHVLEHREWPKGAESDGKLYSLECSRAMTGDHPDSWTETDALGGEFALTKPELTPITGTYQEVAVYAKKLNDTQGSVRHWNFTPALIEPQAVA